MYIWHIWSTLDRYGTCGDNLECRHFPETGESTCVCREDKEVIIVFLERVLSLKEVIIVFRERICR